MRNIEACDRLAERSGIGNRLVRVGERILRIDDYESGCCLDDVTVDAPAVVGRGVGVDAKFAAAGQGDITKHDQSPRCGAFCISRRTLAAACGHDNESVVKGCKRQIYWREASLCASMAAHSRSSVPMSHT